MITSSHATARSSRSQRVYYLLGAFNVLSVLIAVALNFRVVGMYEASVDSSRVWADRMARITDVATTATEANGPGNEVFENGDVPGERAALAEIVARYDTLSAEALAELRSNLPAEQHTALLTQFEAADVEFHAMLDAAERIFVEFENDDVAAAGREMAVYDRQLAATSSGFATLRASLSELQHAEFQSELQAATVLRGASAGLIGLVLFMVAGVLVYGARLNRAFQAAQDRIDRRNRDVHVLLSNVDQGFCTIQADGTVSTERSAAFDRFFRDVGEASTFGQCLAQYDRTTGEWFGIALDEVFDGVLPIELTIDQLPGRVDRGREHLAIEYRPLRDDTGELVSLLVVVSDISAQVEAERAEAEQREVLGLFQRILRDRPGVVDFFREACRIHEALNEHETDADTKKRLLHTLKGNAGLFGLTTFARVCHELESHVAEHGVAIDAAVLGPVNEEWERINRTMRELLGEGDDLALAVDPGEHAAVVQDLLDQQHTGAFRVAHRVASWSLEPAEVRLRRLAEQAQGVAKRVGKPELRVDIDAGDVRLPPDVFGMFWSSLVHIARNAVDHGIEDPDRRVEQGKSADGHVTLSASREDDRVVFQIADDGAGIDWQRVSEKAKHAGLPHETRDDLVEALFASGVSTASSVTDVSGRGVGLGAVRDAVRALNGTVEVRSKRGLGTTWRFSFPATLASPLSSLQRDDQAAA